MKPASSSSCVEDNSLIKGESQKSTLKIGITLRIKMKRSRDQNKDVQAVSSTESVELSNHSTRVADDHGDDVVVVGEHECKVCRKSFSSGRALAGHMRIHGHGTAHSLLSKPAEEAQRLRHNSNDDGESLPAAACKRKIASAAAPDAVCTLCKKEFRSMKSLFRHMRCHRDGEWRGIQPPEKHRSTPSSTVSNVEPKPETQLSSGPVTSGRRKMRTMGDSEPGRAERDDFSDSNYPMLEAAYSLLYLKYSSAVPLAAMDLPPANESKLGEKKAKKKKKMIGALMDGLEKYRCNTCSKTFVSHQALGGHRTSHREDRLVTINISEDQHMEEDDDDEEGKEEGTLQRKRVELSGPANFNGKELQTHECEICHRCFPSGQALGGHKRCHWNEERAAGKVEPVESLSTPTPTMGNEEKSTPDTGADTAAVSMLDFDLNELAPLDDFDLHALYSGAEMVPDSAKLLGPQTASFTTNPQTS